MPNKKFWDNSSLQQDIKWDNQTLPGLSDEELFETNWNLRWSKSDKTKEKIGNSMRGKTLEELVGEEKAKVGRKKRSDFHKGKKRDPKIHEKIVATRRAKGGYENSGMTDHVHKDSTKAVMALKAAVRQEIKRSLGLGRADKVPRELLEQEYKKRGL